MEDLNESQLKTAKTCYGMFKKWCDYIGDEQEHTISNYIKACMNGYPKKSKLSNSLLKARALGIYRVMERITPNIKNKDEFNRAIGLLTKNRK